MADARYEHDCDSCIPLGQYDKFDLYACPIEEDGTCSIIARFGKHGEYWSMQRTMLDDCLADGAMEPFYIPLYVASARYRVRCR
jgi:hypothetical protein